MKNKKQLYKKKQNLIIVLAIVLITIISTLIIYLNCTKKASINANVDFIEAKNEENDVIIIDMPSDNIDNQESEEEIPEVQPSNEQSDEQTTNQESNATSTSQDIKYYIKVNNQANVVTIYTKDANGKYTVPYKAMVCSIGTATPAAGNIYTIPGGTWDRCTWGQMVGEVWAQYYTRIKGSILFHSVPYTKKDKSTLEYWEYDKLGTKASAGCIRLTVQDAKWIYDNCIPGTQVEFYASEDPGPLGKPTAQKISSESESVRGWDPTDPDSKNPWKTYTTSSKQQETQNNNISTNNSSSNNTTNNATNNSIAVNNTTVDNANLNNSSEESDTSGNNKDKNNTTNENIIENSTVEDNTSKNDMESNNINVNNDLAGNTQENTATQNSASENNIKESNTINDV